MGLAKFNLDPLGMVIPFVIGARLISHSVQMTERYAEHYGALGDKKEASIAVMRSMFIPSVASIVTDAAGLFVMCLIPIPLLQNLGWVASIWLLSAILGVSILNPILFSYLPPPFKVQPKRDMLGKTLSGAGVWLTEGGRRGSTRRSIGLVAGTWIIILIGSVIFARQVKVGDAHPGSSLLWPDSTYNQDDGRINQLFPGTNPLYVILEGKEKAALKEPDVLRAVVKPLNGI
jgi:predicted RND superfamily exporter protein